MRMLMITISMLFAFVFFDLPMVWGGPLADLAGSGEPRIKGIDSIRAAIQSRAGRTGRPHNIRRAGQPQRLPRQTPQNMKASLAQLLSDETTNGKTKQMKRSADGKLQPSSPDQFASVDYFPALPGNTWIYSENGSKDSTVKVLPETAFVGEAETSIAVNTETGVSICYTSDNEGVLIHRELFPKVYIQGVNTVDVIVTFVPPIRLADGLVEVGQTAYSMGTAHYVLLPQRRVINLSYTAMYTLQDHREVAVPAGTFEALHFRGTFAISSDSESDTFYVTKDVGLIKGLVESHDQKRIVELGSTNTGHNGERK